MIIRYEGLSLLAFQEVACGFSSGLTKDMVVALHGGLGVGKTTFSRVVIEKFSRDSFLGSPTFGIVHVYSGDGFSIYHVDLYRIGSLREVQEVGFFDILSGSLVLVEWPDILEGAVEFDHRVSIARSVGYEGSKRGIKIESKQ